MTAVRDYTESDRYHYPEITPQSTIVDVGAYNGVWALEMAKKYGCTVLAFEPVHKFWLEASARCSMYPNIILAHAGLGDRYRQVEFGVQDNSSGEFAGSAEREIVTIHPCDILENMPQFPLIKINIEGGEFALLEDILAKGRANWFRNLQIQFHTCAPDWQARYHAIAAGLSKTHELTWRTPFIWENWRLRK
jgi:FkbM family methyltransferase